MTLNELATMQALIGAASTSLTVVTKVEAELTDLLLPHSPLGTEEAGVLITDFVFNSDYKGVKASDLLELLKIA